MAAGCTACGDEKQGESQGQESPASESAPSSAEKSDQAEEQGSDSAQGDAGEEMTDRERIGAEMDEVTLNIRIMNELTNAGRVLEAYEAAVADDPILSKVHLNLTYVTGGDYRDKITTALSAQEDYDLMFCGSWHGIDSFIASGCFTDLTEYFNNDAFPGLKAGFPEDYVEAAASIVKDENGNYKAVNYVIPLADYYEDIRGVYYREDLRQKYNCAEITDDESLMAYLETVSANEPDMVGWAMYNGFFYFETARYSGARDNVIWNDSTQPFGEETPFYVALNEDSTQVLNAVVMGDDASEFEKLPQGYDYDFITEYELEHLKWEKYLDPTRGTTDENGKDPILFYGTLGGYVANENGLEEKYPDASYGFYITEADQRNLVEGAIVCPMKTNNQLVVPAWSENVDATMYFLDWLFGSQENHDLFQYGIEGLDWEATEDGGIRTLEVEEGTQYGMPSYSFTANPNYYRVNEKVYENEAVTKMYEYMLDLSSYTKSPLSGFVFDTTPVETQVANVSALSGQLMLRFALHGDDTQNVIDTWHKDATAVGLEEVRAELIRQVQEFLDMKNSME